MIEATSDQAWLQALLTVEIALAEAEAEAGLIPADHAARIAAAASPDGLDAARLGREAETTGTPVVPLLEALRTRLDPNAAGSLHFGATSQDIVDSASMMVAHRALRVVERDITVAAGHAARLAESHRGTPMVARTLLQQALPTTFGAIAAGWLVGLDTSRRRLREVRTTRLAAQLGGAAGTLAALGESGTAVIEGFAVRLGLAVPDLPWHTERTRIADLAATLGLTAAAVAKPALDIILLSQTEIGELHDPDRGRGGSSALPHKHNSIAAVSARACAFQAPGLVSTLLHAASSQELQRGAGTWHAEWHPLRDLFRSVGSAAAWLADALAGVEVDAGRMRANLERTGGALMSERLRAELARLIGPDQAAVEVDAALAASAAEGGPFASALGDRPAVRNVLDDRRIAELLDPTTYLGSVSAFIDRALAMHAEIEEDDP